MIPALALAILLFPVAAADDPVALADQARRNVGLVPEEGRVGCGPWLTGHTAACLRPTPEPRRPDATVCAIGECATAGAGAGAECLDAPNVCARARALCGERYGIAVQPCAVVALGEPASCGGCTAAVLMGESASGCESCVVVATGDAAAECSRPWPSPCDAVSLTGNASCRRSEAGPARACVAVAPLGARDCGGTACWP